jgi:hypothetical protein
VCPGNQRRLFFSLSPSVGGSAGNIYDGKVYIQRFSGRETYDTLVHIADDPWCAPIRFYHPVHLEVPHRYHDLRDGEVSTIYSPILVFSFFVFKPIFDLCVSLEIQTMGDDSKDLPENAVVIILHWCYESEDARDTRGNTSINCLKLPR